jgi:hypothetical protein
LRENEVENELIQIEEMNLRDDEEENELIQIDAMMIQPSISESSTEEAISNSLPEHSRLSLGQEYHDTLTISYENKELQIYNYRHYARISHQACGSKQLERS